MIAFAASADLSWSPAAYCVSTISMSGAFSSMYCVNPSTRCCPVCDVWSCATMAILPLPTSSAMCLAASADAARLSVDTVVTGTSESTPESKAMTGIPRDSASVIIGIDASESRAAKPSASGFLSSAVCSMVSCFSTSVSVSGPSNVTSTSSSAAASSAPCLTACQNWCWKPLETRAT